MNPRTALIAIVALGAVAAVIGSGLYVTKGNRLKLEGRVLGVRSYQIDPQTTVVAIDFQAKNPSTQQFQLKEAAVTLETADGRKVEGGVFSENEAQRVFEYYPVLGKKYNQTLLMRTKIESGQSMDRMLAVKFEVADDVVQKRKGLRIRFEEVDGTVSEIVEQK